MTHVKGHHRKIKGKQVWVKPHERRGGSRGSVPKRKPKDKVDIIGDQIDRNYKTFVEVNWDDLEKELKELPKYGEDEERPYAYFLVNKQTKNVSFDGIMCSDYYGGFSPESEWGFNVMVDRNTTKQELLDVDASEESYYYEDFN